MWGGVVVTEVEVLKYIDLENDRETGVIHGKKVWYIYMCVLLIL